MKNGEFSSSEIPKTDIRKRINTKKCAKSLKEYVREYCESSSIQGLAYMAKNISPIERIWWTLVFTACVSGSCLMVNHLFEKWKSSPVLVSFATQEFEISEVPFPAVTICPETKISSSCLNYTKVLRERRKSEISLSSLKQNIYFDFMAVFCKSENHEGTLAVLEKFFREVLGEKYLEEESSSINHSEASLDDYSGFLSNCSAVNLDTAICMWMGQTVKCSEVMMPVMTDEGLCYAFNMYDVRDIYSDLNSMEYFPEGIRRRDWNPDDGYRKNISDLEYMYPRKVSQSGIDNGFTAIFQTKVEDINYACRDLSTQGLRVSLHTATRIARPAQVFFSVGLDQLTIAAVTPALTTTTKKIQDYDPEKRRCYFGHERQLKYFKYYSQSNCNLECWTNYTQQQCGCAIYYMPRDNRTKVCSLEKRFCVDDAKKSYSQSILRERLESTETDIGTKTAACHCLSLCSDLTYNVEISSGESNFSNDDEALSGTVRDEVSDVRYSAVRVFFKNNYFLPTQRSELYGTTDLISNIGGILGLFIGFSLISVGEIIYFLSLRLIVNYRKFRY